MSEEDKSDSSDKEECMEDEQSQGEIHMKSDLRYRRQLLSCDEDFMNEDFDQVETVLVDSIGVSAWDRTVPNPKYIVKVQRKKKIDTSVDVEDDDNITSRYSIPTRRNYELDFVSCPAWRMGVEPMTYRYIPNNGRYRAFKLAKRFDTPKAFKKSFSSSKLLSDQTQLQREIHRELRKEFELFISLERQKSSLIRQQEAKQRLKVEQRNKSYSLNNGFEMSRTDKPYLDSKSVSEASYDEKQDSKKQEPRRPPTNLPPLNMQHLSKEEGEYYLEQVSSRLRELEKTAAVTKLNRKKYNEQEEGYLSASGCAKQTQSDPSLYCSPRDASNNMKSSINTFNKPKKLPTINDSTKDKEVGSTQIYPGVLYDQPVPEQSDLFLGELKISKFASVDKSFDISSTQHVSKTNSRKNSETSHTKVSRKSPENTQAKPVFSHPLMYHPPDLSKADETANPEPSLYDTRGVVQKPRADSGHIQLFREYKLRKGSDNPFNEVDPETVKILDNIRQSYNMNDISKQDDEISLESRAYDASIKDASKQFRYTKFVDPRGQNMTPNYEDYAKSQVLRSESGKSLQENEILNNFTTKDYGVEHKKVGANSYTNKLPRYANPTAVGAADAVGLGKALQGVPLITQSNVTKRASVRGNFMPEVMVRRAEIAVTNKRII